jgi:quinol monooxygenase YgiN
VEHVRVNFMTVDPQRFDDAVGFLENQVKPAVEQEVGCLGLAMAVDPELAVAVISSYWISGDAMRESAGSTAALRKEAVRRSGGTVTVEHYEVSSRSRPVRPEPGAGVRVTRADLDTRRLDDAIAAYEDTALPWLSAADGFCSAHLFVHRPTGHAIQETVWADMDVLTRSRTTAAMVRTETVAATDALIRGLAEYRLAFAPASRT